MSKGKQQTHPAAEHDRLTDMGNARRLIQQHGQDLCYCEEWGKWLVWNGGQWTTEKAHEVMERAKVTIRNLHVTALTIEDVEKRHRFLRQAIASESAPRLRGMLELAKTEPGVPTAVEQLDRDIWAFNVRNGTLDLCNGNLHPHRREELITKQAPVDYDPDALCPGWEAFLRQIFSGDEALIRFVQKAVGYSLTGSIQEQCLFILYGIGANGKSTFLNTISLLLGAYHSHTPTETLLVKRTDGISNDLARLQGARFVTAVEAEGGRRLAEAQIKQLTGGDTVTARYLYRELFEFQPTFKLWLAVNHKPTIHGDDLGIWRRIRLLPFTVTIPPEEQDRQLADKLRAELSGILRWAVEGCQMWQQEALEPPKAVTEATGSYRAEMSVIARFVQECCSLGPGKHVNKVDLYQEYQGWCAQVGETAVNYKALAQDGFQGAT